MALTSFSGIYVGNEVNKFYQMNGAVTVNTTIEMEENPYTKSELVKRDIKKKLILLKCRQSGAHYQTAISRTPLTLIHKANLCGDPKIL